MCSTPTSSASAGATATALAAVSPATFCYEFMYRTFPLSTLQYPVTDTEIPGTSGSTTTISDGAEATDVGKTTAAEGAAEMESTTMEDEPIAEGETTTGEEGAATGSTGEEAGTTETTTKGEGSELETPSGKEGPQEKNTPGENNGGLEEATEDNGTTTDTEDDDEEVAGGEVHIARITLFRGGPMLRISTPQLTELQSCQKQKW